MACNCIAVQVQSIQTGRMSCSLGRQQHLLLPAAVARCVSAAYELSFASGWQWKSGSSSRANRNVCTISSPCVCVPSQRQQRVVAHLDGWRLAASRPAQCRFDAATASLRCVPPPRCPTQSAGAGKSVALLPCMAPNPCSGCCSIHRCHRHAKTLPLAPAERLLGSEGLTLLSLPCVAM